VEAEYVFFFYSVNNYINKDSSSKFKKKICKNDCVTVVTSYTLIFSKIIAAPDVYCTYQMKLGCCYIEIYIVYQIREVSPKLHIVVTIILRCCLVQFSLLTSGEPHPAHQQT
jgi:hypothetical protein